jgi:HEAT repeat protein
MKASETLIALVNQMPQPDAKRILGTVDKPAVEKALAEILRGGRDNIAGLIDLLVEAGKGDDGKARYALHALTVEVCKRKHGKQRQTFVEVLASALGGDRPKEVRAFLIRQVQVAGTREAVPALGKQLLDEDLCEPAAQALLAIKEAAVEQFRAALPKATSKQKLTIVQALGVLRDEKSARTLKDLVSDRDREVRLAAGWALARIGDAGSADLLLKAADKAGFERIKATQACLLLAETLRASGKKKEAARVYTHLRDTRTDPSERYVKEAALRGLASVG